MKMKFAESNTLIYHCDNLELLRELPKGSVNLIYCDILYNTGKQFKDYNDKLGSPTEAVEWYRPRFREMYRVLAANGSIFIHCNWRLDSYIRVLLDEIFGRDCFRNRIYRKHSGLRSFPDNFDSQVDIILYYVKDPKNFVFNETHSGKPNIKPLYEDGILDGRSEVRNYFGEQIDLAARGKHWLATPKQFEKIVAAGEFLLIEGLPYRFSDVVPISNLWDEPEMLDTYSRNNPAEAYDTPKPEAVLERIISTCSNPGDLVADFFLGGGTTAVVSKRLERRFVGCDISLKACKVTINKLYPDWNEWSSAYDRLRRFT